MVTVALVGRNSKPWPLTVTRVPPPAEPAAGEMAAMAIRYSNVSSTGTSARPTSGTWTVTATTPGGALMATHVTFDWLSATSTTETEPHA